MSTIVYVVTTRVETGKNDTKIVGLYKSDLYGYLKGYKNGLIDLRGDILDLIHCGMLQEDDSDIQDDLKKIDEELEELNDFSYILPRTIQLSKCEMNVNLMTVNE